MAGARTNFWKAFEGVWYASNVMNVHEYACLLHKGSLDAGFEVG